MGVFWYCCANPAPRPRPGSGPRIWAALLGLDRAPEVKTL